MENLLNALADPYDYDTIQEEYCSLPEASDVHIKRFVGRKNMKSMNLHVSNNCSGEYGK